MVPLQLHSFMNEFMGSCQNTNQRVPFCSEPFPVINLPPLSAGCLQLLFPSFFPWLQDLGCSVPGLCLSLGGPLAGKDPGGRAPVLSIGQNLLGQTVTAQDHGQRGAAARGSILGW